MNIYAAESLALLDSKDNRFDRMPCRLTSRAIAASRPLARLGNILWMRYYLVKASEQEYHQVTRR